MGHWVCGKNRERLVREASQPSGYEPLSGYYEKLRIWAIPVSLNNVQHVHYVPHVQNLGTPYDPSLGTQGKDRFV